MATTFADDDAGYEAWLRGHPETFVLNCERNPRATYLVLHRASCHTISGDPSSGATWTAGAYIKVCADTAAELESWAERTAGGLPQRCGTCAP